MSIGRPDPNAFKVITPDVYDQNLAEIARARATLEAFEKMNQAGKSNYDRLVEQEERELEQKIQEGLAAKQRLQQLRNLKTNGLLENSSRIEEVGNANPNGYDSVGRPGHSPNVPTSFAPPVQNAFGSHFQPNGPSVNSNPQTNFSYLPQQYPYSTPSVQPASQSSSASYNGGSAQSMSQSGSAQRTNVNQTYYRAPMPVQSNNVHGHLDTSNINQYRPPQAPGGRYRPQTQLDSSYHRNGPNQGQNPDHPRRSSMGPPLQRQSYSEVHYQQQIPRASTGTSSLVDALGVVNSSNPQSTVSNSNVPSNPPAVVAPASSKIPPIASSSRSRKSRAEQSSSQKISYGPEIIAKEPEVTIPMKPTRTQVNLFNNYFDQWATRVPPQSEYNGPITCGKYSIKCLKHTDGSVRFIFTLPTGVVHMLASKFLDGLSSTTAEPIDHSPLQHDATIPKPSTSANQPPPNMQASASTSLPTATSQGQGVSAPGVGTEKDPSSSNVPSQASVSTPQTPPPRPPIERRVGTITSPQHADKKRIAQSVLFALGKRRRENDNIPEGASQVSKKQALSTTANGKPQDIPSSAESIKGDPPKAISDKSAIKGSLEPKPTSTIPPNTPSSTPTSASLPQALPQTVDQPSLHVITPAGSTLLYHHQPYGQGSFTHPVPAPQQMQYVKFTPLIPYYAWKPAPVAGPSSVAPSQSEPKKLVDIAKNIKASKSQIPNPQASEKISNPLVSRQNVPSSSTISPAVGDTSKSKRLDKKRLASTATTTSLQKGPSSTQTQPGSFLESPGVPPNPPATAIFQTPVPIQTSSSATTSGLANTINHAENLIPQITSLKAPSRRSPERVASSSKLVPRKDPLFLPSPSAEPEGDLWNVENDEGYLNQTLDTQVTKTRVAPKVNRAYVLVPPAPEYLIRYRQQKNKRRESRPSSSSSGTRRINGTWTDSSVSTPFGEEDVSYSAESQPVSVLEEKEREAIQLACSRLEVVPCRWDGCDAELNSIEALIRHLNIHKPVPTQHTKIFMCRWTQCGQQGIALEDVHLEKHALLPLRCPYSGCDDTFRSGGQLLRHFRARHSKDELKPAAKLAPPSTIPALPPIPGTIPSYLIVTNLAGREVLSKERHSIIGPQVLRGMTSEQNAPTRRSRKNARPASRPALPEARTDLTNDYHFLENNNSVRSSTYFSKASDLEHSDLDSDSVLKMLEQGIVLLGSDDGTDHEGGDDDELISPPSSPLQRRELRAEVKVEPGWEKEPGFGGSTVRLDEHSSDEDAAVETMLTDMTSMGTSTS